VDVLLICGFDPRMPPNPRDAWSLTVPWTTRSTFWTPQRSVSISPPELNLIFDEQIFPLARRYQRCIRAHVLPSNGPMVRE
jgi:hypothetical protein